MKALSIKQPWAWAIIHGGKPVENRTWPTKYRGQILIHAGKTIDHEGYCWIAENQNRLACFLPPMDELKTGGVIGQAIVVDCVQNHSSRWFFGPWGFVLEEPEALEFIPLRGHLGLFDVDKSLLENGCRTELLMQRKLF